MDEMTWTDPQLKALYEQQPQGDGAAPGGASGTVQQVGGAVQGVHPQQPARESRTCASTG